MKKRALGLTYISEYDALYFATEECCDQLRALGYEAEIINLGDPAAGNELLRQLKTREHEFCFGLQGVGSRLELGGDNLWQALQIPFVGIHYDHPCSNIFNHDNPSPFVAHLYAYQSLYELRQRYILHPAKSDHFRFEVKILPPSPVPFAERSIRLLYLKTGAGIDIAKTEIDNLMPALREAVWHHIARAEADPDLSLGEMAQDILGAAGRDWRHEFNLFWGLMHVMNKYLRQKRAIDFVNWLKDQPGAVIIGDGWDFIDKANIKAVFKPSVSVDIPKIYAQTQYICNTSPYGEDIVHERIAFGLLGACCVFSDANRLLHKICGDVAALGLFNAKDNLADQAAAFLEDKRNADKAQMAHDQALGLFQPGDKIAKVISLAHAMRKENVSHIGM